MKTGAQFIETFAKNDITHDSKDNRFQDTLDFQDFVGRMNNTELFDFYKDLDQNQRRTFIWACTCTLHQDTAVDVIKSTTVALERHRLYDEFETDIGQKEDNLFKREQTFRDCKKPIHKKIASLKSEIESLKNRLTWSEAQVEGLREAKNRLYKRNHQLESKSVAFDNIRSAMALLLDETH